jgi:hypothetical protein
MRRFCAPRLHRRNGMTHHSWPQRTMRSDSCDTVTCLYCRKENAKADRRCASRDPDSRPVPAPPGGLRVLQGLASDRIVNEARSPDQESRRSTAGEAECPGADRGECRLPSHVRAGQAALERGAWEEARDCFDAALLEDPTEARAWGRVERACAAYRHRGDEVAAAGSHALLHIGGGGRPGHENAEAGAPGPSPLLHDRRVRAGPGLGARRRMVRSG